MRSEKRLWIYTGLSVPEGAGLVRRLAARARPVGRSAAAVRILLLGDSHAQGLLPPMSRLAGDAGAALHADARLGSSLRDWATQGWLQAHLAAFRPTAVFVAMDHRDPLARRMVQARVRRIRAEIFWLLPAGVPHVSSTHFIGATGDGAASFAAWAARAWSGLSQENLQ